jgi:hypothetical protein
LKTKKGKGKKKTVSLSPHGLGRFWPFLPPPEAQAKPIYKPSPTPLFIFNLPSGNSSVAASPSSLAPRCALSTSTALVVYKYSTLPPKKP